MANPSYPRDKKSDIYSLAVIFWQLTSSKQPFEYETDIGLDIRIIKGKRETPILNTNSEYVKLYHSKYKISNDIFSYFFATQHI